MTHYDLRHIPTQSGRRRRVKTIPGSCRSHHWFLELQQLGLLILAGLARFTSQFCPAPVTPVSNTGPVHPNPLLFHDVLSWLLHLCPLDSNKLQNVNFVANICQFLTSLHLIILFTLEKHSLTGIFVKAGIQIPTKKTK